MTTSAEAPSLTEGALPAVTVPSFSKAGFSAASFSSVVSRRGPSRGDDRRIALALRDGDGRDFRLELAGVHGGHGLHLALIGELVLVLARHLVLLRDDLGGRAHVVVVVVLPEAVVDHAVHHLLVAHLEAFARAEQVVGRAAHVLHAAGHDALGVAGLDGLRGQHHRLEPRAADLVDGQRAHRVGNAAIDQRLPRRGLPHARLQHVAHDHFFHRVRPRRPASRPP
jgi:hypothetical protein